MIVHIERPPSEAEWDAEFTFVVMECGAWTMIGEDAVTRPPMDFVTPEHADKADCPDCRAKLNQKTAVTKKLERVR